MLECRGLVLRPWAPAAGGATRAVLDAATGAPLGFARWRRAAAGWPRRPLLEVFETEDAALLCTAHARWGLARWWEVRDADAHPVGAFRPRWHTTGVEDWSGQPLARIEHPAPGAAGRVVSPAGQEVATLRPGGDGTTVAFTDALPDNPFHRMVLLAALLTMPAPTNPHQPG